MTGRFRQGRVEIDHEEHEGHEVFFSMLFRVEHFLLKNQD
jgi:hypothetical protein